MKHKNSKIIKIQIKPKFGSSYSSIESPIMEKLTQNSQVVVKAPAQWLEPFKFQKLTTLKTPNETKIMLNSQSITNRIQFEQNQPRLIVKNISELSLTNSNNDIYLNSIDRTLAKLNQTYIYSPPSTVNQTTTHSSFLSSMSTTQILKSSNKLNINDYFSCERNLTRLTVFYSSLDRLNCSEVARNSSLLKCFDELLERKLLDKLGKFYYLKLKPLLIPKAKTICVNISINNNMSTNKIKNEMLESENNKMSSIYFNEIEKENFLSENALEHSLNCTLITKKSTNRKKLIWRLYLLLKNQTCIPAEPFKTYGHHSAEAVSIGKSAENEENDRNKSNSIFICFISLSMLKNLKFLFFQDSTSSPSSLMSYLTKSPLSANKIILIILITCGVCFILFANTILYIILKLR
jgi:hypothetical protein